MSTNEALSLDRFTNQPQVARLGSSRLRTDIATTEGPFHYLSEHKIHYPETVTGALADLYAEYNKAFGPLVETNREWVTDYQYCMLGPDRSPVNFWVQIDMVGLPDDYLLEASRFDQNEVREDLRKRLFEIENSLAMYQLLMRLFSRDGQNSQFGTRFRESLNIVRQIHNRPIALLAVTEEKYQAMRESEFGKQQGEQLIDEEVKDLSGFDAFFGPQEFMDYLRKSGGNCDYLLYVRSSDPLIKLKKPKTVVENPLLQEDDLRRIIKAHAITFNIDNPDCSTGDPRRINDTKAYLPPMGMGYPVYDIQDLNSEGLHTYLTAQGIDPELIASGDVVLRAKPMQTSYGGYGHERASTKNPKFWQDLKRDLRDRGPYIIQPEMPTPMITNETDGQSFHYIDRNFFATDGGNYTFMGGFRSHMPIASREAERGRNHGSQFTVWAEVY